MPLHCPSCAAPFEAGTPTCPVCGRPLPASSPDIPAGAPPSGSEPLEKRRDERLSVATDVRIRKLGPGGVPEREERTIAHDLSRSGMRLLTSWSDLEQGDRISIEEVGGSFSSSAVVRHLDRGTDQITRVGIEFIENRAPDRLAGTTTGIARPVFDTARSYPGLASEGPSRLYPFANSPPVSRAAVTGSVPRPTTTGSTPRPASAGPTARPVSPPGRSGAPPSPPPASPLSAEKLVEQITEAKAAARGLIGEGKIWEALDHLARAQALAEGTPEAHALRILTCETQAKVPSLMRAAQATLEDMAHADPADAAVHSALGRIFREAGLAARARIAFQRALALDPSNREATDALGVLNDPARGR